MHKQLQVEPHTARVHTTADGIIPLGRLLAAIGGIYVAQSLVTGVALQSVPALLRAAGASLEIVGLASLFMLPWALKFLWAPAVERWRLPAGQAARRSRHIILLGQWLLAGCLLLLAMVGAWLPAPAGTPLGVPTLGLMAALLVAAMLAASIDIACDGYAIDQLPVRHRGWGNVAQVGGSYVGIAIGGSGFLLLASACGWPVAMAVMGGGILLLTLPVLGTPEAPRESSQTTHQPSLRAALVSRNIRHGLVLVVCLGAGIRLASGMLGPMLIDRGASLALLGTVHGLVGIGAGLVGTLLGGLLVRQLGARRAVPWAVGAQAAALLALSLAASTASLPALIALAGLLFAAMACGFVAIYAFLMGLASPRQAGLDFTLFQCADAMVAMIGGMAGGWLAQRGGYTLCLGLAAASSACAGLGAARWVPTPMPAHPGTDPQTASAKDSSTALNNTEPLAQTAP